MEELCGKSRRGAAAKNGFDTTKKTGYTFSNKQK
jgi:hypothetical protein